MNPKRGENVADLTEKLAEIVAQGVECDPDDAESGETAAAERLGEIRGRLAALSPPDSGAAASRRLREGRGDPYRGAGSAYREAAEKGDSEALAALEREREELMAERALLDRQRSALAGLARRARERVQEETAPDRLADALESFPALLDEAEEALQAFRDARERIEEAGQEIIGCRKIMGDDAPGLSPQELRRWGLIAGEKPGEPAVEREVGADGRPRQTRHLFRTRAIQRERFKALAPPRDELIEAVRRKVTSERDRTVRHLGPAPDVDPQRVQDAVEEARHRAIVTGEFEDLEVPEPAAKAS